MLSLRPFVDMAKREGACDDVIFDLQNSTMEEFIDPVWIGEKSGSNFEYCIFWMGNNYLLPKKLQAEYTYIMETFGDRDISGFYEKVRQYIRNH